MASRISPGELALTQAQHLDASGYKEQAHELLNEYFSKLRIRSWDPVHDRLAQLALNLSAELHQPTKALHSHVRFSVDYALDVLPATLLSYIEKCNSKIEEEQKRADNEQLKARSPLLKGVDLPKLLMDSIVTPVIDFLFNALHQILNELVKQLGKYDEIYHIIIKKGFEYCVKYKRIEDVELFSNDLSYYRGHNEPKGEVILRYIDSQYARYLAASELNSMNQALAALSEANDIIKLNYKTIPIEYVEKIEIAKHKILQKGEYQLFTAIQHQNLFELYKETNLKSEEYLEKMSDIILIEIITSPLNDSMYDYSALINFPRFLNQTSGNIPNRSDLILTQLETKQKSTLTEFVRCAEFGSDPFEICNKFNEFKNLHSSEDYYKDFEDKLSSYAAIRAIQVISNHYSTIDFNELSEIISWIPIEKIQEIIVDAAHQSLIPVHINMKDNSIDFNPRGNQCLENALSPLNDQLCHIFDEFQNIKKRLPEDLSAASTNSKLSSEIYSSEADFRKRMEILKQRTFNQKEKQRKKEEERIAKERLLQEKLEKEELAKREEEKRKKEIRDKRESEYNYAYTEAKIIARDNEIDFEDFLDEKVEGMPTRSGKSKADDIDWINYKNKQIKILAIQKMRSDNDKVSEKMRKIKEEYGRERIKTLLAQKEAIKNSYESEVQLMQKLKEMHKNLNEKSFEVETRNYLRMCKICKDSIDDFTAFTIQVRKENEKPGLGTSVQPPLPQILEQEKEIVKEDVKEENKGEEETKKETEQQQPQKEENEQQPQKEESDKPAAYKPPQPGAYKPPQPAAYKPPQSSNGRQSSRQWGNQSSNGRQWNDQSSNGRQSPRQGGNNNQSGGQEGKFNFKSNGPRRTPSNENMQSRFGTASK